MNTTRFPVDLNVRYQSKGRYLVMRKPMSVALCLHNVAE